MLIQCKKDPAFQARMKRLFHEDIIFAFNTFFYTLDVRVKEGQHQPFCTYPYQDEALLSLVASIEDGEDEVWEKSRDMGASWLILTTYLWFWLKPDMVADFLMGSRVEDYVDKKGDMRALFPKVRYALYRLPKFLRPKGFVMRKHDTYLRLVNPETGSAIIGESNNANFSTGGRFLSALFDEFAKWESTDVAAWTAAGDATPCRVANSTPFGAGGQYFSLTTDGRTKKTTLHWMVHPKKALGLSCVWPAPNEEDKSRLQEMWEPEEYLTSPWYEKEKLRRSPKEIAQELDINYLGSGDPIFDGKAWDSLQLFNKISDSPISWGRFNTTEKALELTEKNPPDWEGELVIYKMLDKKHFYTIGVDVVEGVEGGDYASITVYDRITKSVVATYFSRIDEVGLARIVQLVAEFYSIEPEHHDSPWVGIETNGPGLSTFDFADSYGVTNLFMAPRYDVSTGGISHKKGWRTDTVSRNELVSGVRNWLIDRAGDLSSHRLCGELMTFVRSRTGKPQAKAGCHDDDIISFGICIQIDEIAPLPDKRRVQLRAVTHADIAGKGDWAEVDEPTTIQERCLQAAMLKQVESKIDRDLLREVMNY